MSNDTNEIPQEPGHGSTRLLQITEPDLAELERLLPKILNDHVMQSGNDGPTSQRLRVAYISIQRILTNVRWDYGPATEVYRVPE